MNPCMQLFGVAFHIFIKPWQKPDVQHFEARSQLEWQPHDESPRPGLKTAEMTQRSPSQDGGSLPFTTGISVGCSAGNLVTWTPVFVAKSFIPNFSPL